MQQLMQQLTHPQVIFKVFFMIYFAKIAKKEASLSSPSTIKEKMLAMLFLACLMIAITFLAVYK